MAEASPVSKLETTLAATVGVEDENALLLTLATAELAVPQMSTTEATESLTLPYIERIGTRYALVFSSRQRMEEFGLEPQSVITMRGHELGEAWPEGADIWLAVDAGCEHSAAISADRVRRLATFGA